MVVLGGGWAGLLAAREVRKQRPEARVIVLEQSPREQSGGLLRSVHEDGFTFDLGGPHILFSKFRETLEEVRGILGDNVVERPRRNFVLFDGQFVPYPFENGIYRLAPETRARLGRGLIEAALERARKPGWAPANFREWVYGFFGQGMGSEYLDPYNTKIWKRPLDSLACDWVYTPGRVPVPEVADIALALAGIESVGYKEQSHFLYPKHGGIRSLYESVLEQVLRSEVEVRFHEPVSEVRREPSGWTVNGAFRAPTVVSTLALPDLLPMLRGVTDLTPWVPRFDYNRVVVVGVALDRPDPNQTAVYVPRADVPFHRYTWMSYLNPPTAEGSSNLIAEVTVPKGQPIDAPAVTEGVLQGLVTIGVAPTRASIRFARTWVNEYGYPIYTMDHTAAKRAVLPTLREHGLHSVGRWGSWEYWNTDMVLRTVRTTVTEMLAVPGSAKP